jgi:hypothetical protein
MKTKTLSPKYRITQEDEARGYKIFSRYYGVGDGPVPTLDKVDLAEILMDAGEMHRKTGQWPTVGEVLANRQREEQEHERKRK